MFPSSLNTKRRAACAAKNMKKEIGSEQEDVRIQEECYKNICHIGGFLKKRSSIQSSNTSSSSPLPAVKAVHHKKQLKKIFKDLKTVSSENEFIIESDNESPNNVDDGQNLNQNLQQQQKQRPSSHPLLKQSPPSQNIKSSNEQFMINGFADKKNKASDETLTYSLEASSSTSTQASSEEKGEEDEKLEHSPSKKIKTESESSYRYCSRKDSMLSSSSETQAWFGGSNDDFYLSNQSPLTSNLPTPNFTSTSPESKFISSSSSQCSSSFKNEHSRFQLDDCEGMNAPTRKNSVDSFDSSYSCHLLLSPPLSSFNNNRINGCSLSLNELRQKTLENEDEQKRMKAEWRASSQASAQQEAAEEERMKRAIEQGRQLVEQRMGRLAAENQTINGFPCCTFTIRCFLKHTFVLHVEDLLAGTWCNQCNENLLKAQEYAQENKGVLLSQFYAKNLKFKCQKNHVWESSHQTYKQRWCSQCKKIVKDQFKQYIKEEEAKKQAEYQKNQEEMYQEARRKAMISQSPNEQCGSSEEYKKKVIIAAKQVEREVEKIAEQQARDYIQNSQNNSENPCSLIQLKEMFKIILFPDQILQVYYLNLECEVLKSEYRNIARYVHPDKNCHPRAAESFQKLNNFYSLALPKV